MKHLKYKPNISEWEIEAITEVSEIIQYSLRKAVTEALADEIDAARSSNN